MPLHNGDIPVETPYTLAYLGKTSGIRQEQRQRQLGVGRGKSGGEGGGGGTRQKQRQNSCANIDVPRPNSQRKRMYKLERQGEWGRGGQVG